MSLLRRSDPNLRPVRPERREAERPSAAQPRNLARPPLGDDGFARSALGGPAAQSFSQGVTPNLAIPDLAKVTSSLHFEDKAAIQSLKLNLELTHSYKGDLVVTLTSPSGKSAVIHNREGGSGKDLKGSFDLAQFQGEPLSGDWTLTVEDKAKRDTGTLKAWSLDAVARPPVPTPETDEHSAITLSSFDDDPMVQASHVEELSKSDFTLGNDGNPTGLVGPHVKMVEGPTVGEVSATGNITPFATNPWSLPAPGQGPDGGGFVFSDEDRFPSHQVQLGADGKPVKNSAGLQVWTPRGDHLAQTTAFEAANTVLHQAEAWGGQPVKWGKDGQLEIEPHSFIGLNANFNPIDKKLRFGVVPYKTAEGELKMFELASSWEVVAHEAGHAVHDVLKPNKGLVDLGYRQWGESFGDQLAMWSSLQDPKRVDALLSETGGDLTKPNALSKIAEAYGTLSGKPDSGLRDATNTLKISDTGTEFHERSEVLTGASYQLFLGVYAGLKDGGASPADALKQAGAVMGTFLMRSTEHTPENAMTLEDVGKAYLKIDQEYFGGKYKDLIAGELSRREIFGKDSLKDFARHEAMIPKLTLTGPRTTESIAKLLKDNEAKLNLGGGFGAKLQSFHVDDQGRTIVRFQLQRGPEVINNHALMVFRPDGSLMDYQNPKPASLDPAEAVALLDRAHALGLQRKGTLQFVAKPDGSGFTVQAVSEHRRGRDPHLQVFSLEAPAGKRAEYFHVERARENTAQLAARLPPGATRLN